MNQQTGIFIVGTLKGYFETANGQYTNRFLAVVTHSFQDRYGQEQENIEEIEVSPKFASMVAATTSSLVGKLVHVPMGVTHKKGEKNGRPWSFVKYYLRNENINAVDVLHDIKDKKVA